MKIDSYETAISSWRNILINKSFDDPNFKLILYITYDGIHAGIHAGWTYNYQIPHLNDICTYVYVDKENIFTMSENEYNGFVLTLILKDKQKKYSKN